jgi:hypothetical protein
VKGDVGVDFPLPVEGHDNERAEEIAVERLCVLDAASEPQRDVRGTLERDAIRSARLRSIGKRVGRHALRDAGLLAFP